MANRVSWLSQNIKRLLVSGLLLMSFSANAQTPDADDENIDDSNLKARIERLESLVPALQEEITRLQLEATVPMPSQEPFFGYGPAFSRVYSSRHPLSLGGTVEFYYQGQRGAVDRAGISHFRTFLGYRLATNFVFNSAIAFDLDAPGQDPAGATDNFLHLDFAYVDWLASDSFVLRTGVVPVPLGLRRLRPEPTFYPDPIQSRLEEFLLPFDASRPGLLGIYQRGKLRAHLGVISAPELNRFQTGTFVEGGLSSRFRTTEMGEIENLALVARVDAGWPNWEGDRRLDFGVSYLGGDTAHRSMVRDAEISIIEAHLEVRHSGWQLIALGGMGDLNSTDEIASELTIQPGSEALGWSVSLYREILRGTQPASLLEGGIFVSHEGFELKESTTLPSRSARAGVVIQPIPSIILKGARQWHLGDAADDDLWQISLGAVF